MDDHGSPVLRALLDAMPDAVASTHARLGDVTVVVNAEKILEVMRFLRDIRCRYRMQRVSRSVRLTRRRLPQPWGTSFGNMGMPTCKLIV